MLNRPMDPDSRSDDDDPADHIDDDLLEEDDAQRRAAEEAAYCSHPRRSAVVDRSYRWKLLVAWPSCV
jgi:hypothetical protein